MENRSKSDLAYPITGQEVYGPINFRGVVMDEDGRPAEGAVVMLFACYYSGLERSLGSTLTDRACAYLISLPKPPDYNELLRFKIRAGKADTIPEARGNKSLGQADQTQQEKSN